MDHVDGEPPRRDLAAILTVLLCYFIIMFVFVGRKRKEKGEKSMESKSKEEQHRVRQRLSSVAVESVEEQQHFEKKSSGEKEGTTVIQRLGDRCSNSSGRKAVD